MGSVMAADHFHGLSYDDLVEMIEEMRPELNKLRVDAKLAVKERYSCLALRDTYDQLKKKNTLLVRRLANLKRRIGYNQWTVQFGG